MKTAELAVTDKSGRHFVTLEDDQIIQVRLRPRNIARFEALDEWPLCMLRKGADGVFFMCVRSDDTLVVDERQVEASAEGEV